MKMKAFVRGLCVAALLALGATAHAQIPAVSITGNSYYGVAIGTWGWQFSVSEALTVSDMGIYDPSGTGLPRDLQIGMWRDSDKALLGSTTVAATAPISDGYRYAAVTPFSITPGDTYRIGFFNSAGDSLIGYNGQGAVFAPPITYLDNGAYTYDSFGYPSVLTNSNLPKYLSANFRFNAPIAPSVPEPGVLSLLGGLVTAGGMAWRRRRA